MLGANEFVNMLWILGFLGFIFIFTPMEEMLDEIFGIENGGD